METMNIYEKLSLIQEELKVPKGKFNSFANFNYRSAEDILDTVKPICKKYKTVLMLTDFVLFFSDSRTYVRATATLQDIESTEFIHKEAFAREQLEKKGMDASQITGSASSYARKYALSGLFCIDDGHDADSGDNRENKEGVSQKPKGKIEDSKKLLENVDSAKGLESWRYKQNDFAWSKEEMNELKNMRKEKEKELTSDN